MKSVGFQTWVFEPGEKQKREANTQIDGVLIKRDLFETADDCTTPEAEDGWTITAMEK